MTNSPSPRPGYDARSGVRASVYRRRVAFDGEIPLSLELDGRRAGSETVYAQAGANALTIVTTLRGAELPVELHSTYVGHPGTPTRATHLRLGPGGHSPYVASTEHNEEDICLVFTPRNAVYDHAHELVQLLSDLGYRPSVRIDDAAFRALEAVAQVSLPDDR